MTPNKDIKLADILTQIISSEDRKNLPFGSNSLILLCQEEEEEPKHSSKCITFKHRLMRQQKDWQDEQGIIQNLGQSALPLFAQIIEKYGKLINPSKKLQQYPEDFPAIAAAKFAPTATDTVAQAYEYSLRTQQSRKYRNYQELFDKWHECLENVIFKNSNWSAQKKNYLKKHGKKHYSKNLTPDKGR
ncbi:MAG TPA: hypothetical protein VGO47_12555 [Chlamydiales bacterium]|jgi:hypothetical protein|nr:hypothetical protein [Chlamydiales bacterium]